METNQPVQNQCFICLRVLGNKYSLARHIWVTHGRVRRHVCQCGRAFATTEQLRRHDNSKHSLQSPYVCQRGCDRGFASYTARTYHHAALHDGVKFRCPMPGCRKNYSSKTNLKNHCSTHIQPVTLALLYLAGLNKY